MPLWTISDATSALKGAVKALTLDERIAALPEGPLVVVVPTARQRKSVLISWAKLHGRGEPPEILTMSGFIRALGHQLLPDGPRIMPDASVDVLLRYAAHAAGSRPGALGLRASRLSRWAQEGMSAGLVQQFSKSADGHRRRRHLASLASVWFEYDVLIGRRACDRGAYAGRVADEVSRRGDVDFVRPSGDVVRRVLVLDTHGVTFTDKMLLHSLCKCNWDIAIAFARELPWREGSAPSRTRTDHMWLVSHGWISTETIASVTAPAEAVVRSFPTRSDEVRRALALVKEGVARGIDLRAMAICIPGLNDYERIITELARDGGVPLDLETGTSLASSRTASAIRSACLVIAGEWQRNDVERLLRDPLVRDAVPDVSHLLRVAREDRIIGGTGPSAWHQRCEHKRFDAYQFAISDPENSEEWNRKRVRYERALRAISALGEKLDIPITYSIDAERFSSIVLENIGKGLHIFDRAVSFEKAAIAAIEESLSSYQAVAKDHRLKPVHFSEHVRSWWTIVQATTVPIENGVRRGLAIVRPAELRGQHWHIVVAVGCVEGEFPRTSQDMLDEDLTPGLRAAIAQESMADISNSVTSAGLLLCTYPETIDDARALPSSLLDRIATRSEPMVEWQSLDRTYGILLDERDRRVRSAEPPTMDRSQRGIVRDLLGEESRILFDEDIAKPVSPSKLDIIAQCPYKFHAQKTLHLDNQASDDTKLTPIERGNLLHELVQRFYRSYQQSGNVDVSNAVSLAACCVDLRNDSFEYHWQKLCAILSELLRELHLDYLYTDVEVRTLIGTADRVGLLRRWLAYEIHDQEISGFLPVLFELEIETEIDVPFGDGTKPVRVKTRIDRIDIKLMEGGLEFVVNDYKSTIGANLTTPIIRDGKVTQMPIYVAATTSYFQQRDILAIPAKAVYRAFGSAISSPEKTKQRAVLVDAKQSLSEQVRDTLCVISTSITDLRSGDYPVRPTKDACTYCAYTALCRIDHWGAA